jgi:hypothetical protein
MITQRIQSWCIDVNTVIASKLTHRCQALDTEFGCFSVYSKLKGSVLSRLNDKWGNVSGTNLSKKIKISQ